MSYKTVAQVNYQIHFKDSLGWYCPGEPWSNPNEALLKEWKEDISRFNRKDVRIAAFINGKYSPALSISAR